MSRSGGDMGKENKIVLKDRVFVGKLPRGISEQDLRRAFDKAGFQVRDVHIQLSMRDKDFAFVSFYNERDAEAALEAARVNPFTVGGHNVIVSEAYKSTNNNKRIPKLVVNQRGFPIPRSARAFESPMGRGFARPGGSRDGSVSPAPQSPSPPLHRSRGAGCRNAEYQHTATANESSNHFYPMAVYKVNEQMHGQYPFHQLVVPQSYVLVPANVPQGAIPPYKFEPMAKKTLLGCHYGGIPYSGGRANPGELLPANPCIDATMIHTIPHEEQFNFPHNYDCCRSPSGGVMSPHLARPSLGYPVDN